MLWDWTFFHNFKDIQQAQFMQINSFIQAQVCLHSFAMEYENFRIL